MKFLAKTFLYLVLPLVLLAGATMGYAYFWAHDPLTLPAKRERDAMNRWRLCPHMQM